MKRMQRPRALLLVAALAAGARSASAVQISEVLYDATGTDNGKVFVELWGVPGTPITGYTLEGVNGGDGAVGPTLTLTPAPSRPTASSSWRTPTAPARRSRTRTRC